MVLWLLEERAGLKNCKATNTGHVQSKASILDKYYKELGTILTIADLKNPEKNFNVDETGVSTEHSSLICARDSSAQSVTPARTYNVTIIGVGNHVPPLCIFVKLQKSEFIESTAPGPCWSWSYTVNKFKFSCF